MTTSSASTILQQSLLSDAEARQLICDLCRHFYSLGWASGTGGGVSIRTTDHIFMAPSGVQKECLSPNDIFKLTLDGDIIDSPPSLRVSACQPLFMHAYKLKNAGAVIHSHSMNALLVTLITNQSFVSITGLEMLKGISGVGVFDKHDVPIIENTAHECDLADSLKDAMLAYPKSNAVLVRGHGVYVWGKNWVQAKTQAESYDYLFEALIKMVQLGIDTEKGRLK